MIETVAGLVAIIGGLYALWLKASRWWRRRKRRGPPRIRWMDD